MSGLQLRLATIAAAVLVSVWMLVPTVMGEAVSVASRLEKLTSELGYPVLIGPKAYDMSGLKSEQGLQISIERHHRICNQRQDLQLSHLELVLNVFQFSQKNLDRQREVLKEMVPYQMRIYRSIRYDTFHRDDQMLQKQLLHNLLLLNELRCTFHPFQRQLPQPFSLLGS